MQCKTGSEHIESLKDGRTVYLDGKLVDDVTTHVAYRNAVASAALVYDYQARPENIGLMTFMPEGGKRRVNRCWQMPRNYDELVQRRKALQAWAQVSYGFMGRSPDHVASTVIGQYMGLDVLAKHGPARAKALADYVEYATRNDLFLTYVIVNPQADRSKDWGDQVEELVAQIVDEDSTGLTIRGAKMLGTSSIMANEIFVANLQPLKPGEEALAFSCALPMNTTGVRVLSRKSYEAHAVSIYDNPLSSRFDENDALLYFDNVKVPWERVFVHRDTDMCRAQFHDTPSHCFPELPIPDSPLGEGQISGRRRTQDHRGDRHHQHAASAGTARRLGGQCRHGGGDAFRHGGVRTRARRVLFAEPAYALCRAGGYAGPVPAADKLDSRSGWRGAYHAAIVIPRLG
jgi:4-hydroxyphenylacetate 3-monooxygenase